MFTSRVNLNIYICNFFSLLLWFVEFCCSVWTFVLISKLSNYLSFLTNIDIHQLQHLQIYMLKNSKQAWKMPLWIRPTTAGWTDRLLDVVSAWRRWSVGCWVTRGFSWSFVGAAAAEEAASYDDETGSSPSHKQSAAKLIPGVGWSERVVEVLRYSVAVPGRSHQSKHTSDNEDNSSTQSHFVFLLRKVWHTCGALHAHHRHQNGNKAQQDGGQHQASSTLNDPW